MMKQNLSDKGLRKAMQEQSPRLSSNFTFRAMLKVEEMLRIQEAKQEKRMFSFAIQQEDFTIKRI
jgi:hypothetical protein